MLLLKGCHKFLYLRGHLKFGMHGGEKQNVAANSAVLGALILDLPMRG